MGAKLVMARCARPWCRLLGLLLVAEACGGDAGPKTADPLDPGERDAGQDASATDAAEAAVDMDMEKPRDAGGTCDAADLALSWPVAGERGVHWEVTNYVDLETGPGLRDFTGALGTLAKTYEGHEGVDISIANFRAMDRGVAVLAALDGEVVDVEDGFFDRQIDRHLPACADMQNYITLQHAQTGFRTQYVHLKTGSAVVHVGDRVKAGDTIGMVGSAGCSSAPHLHLNVLDCAGVTHDPFLEGLFKAQPAYEADLALMETMLTSGGIYDVEGVQDPVSDALALEASNVLGVGAAFGGGREGDKVQLSITRPDGSVFTSLTNVFGQNPRLTYAYWNVVPDGIEGSWQFTISRGEQLLATRTLQIARQAAPGQRLLLAVAPDALPSTLTEQSSEGFYARAIDGYFDGAAHRYNVLLDDAAERVVRAGLDASAMQTESDTLASLALRPVHSDVFGTAEGPRYATVFAMAPDARAYWGVTLEEHAAQLDLLAAQNFAPVALGMWRTGTDTQVAAVYAPLKAFTFRHYLGLDQATFSTRDASQLNAKRYPSQLHVTDEPAGSLMSGTWTSFHPGEWLLVRDLDRATLESTHATEASKGRVLTDLSTYQTELGLRYAALWLAQP